MIVQSLCNSCLQPYVLVIETQDVPLVSQLQETDGKFCKCPRLCGGLINLAGSGSIDAVREGVQLREPITLSGTQLYRAVMGAGLPDEVATQKVTVEAMLLAHKVVSAKLEQDRSFVYLHELVLDNGITLHFTSGLRGARVLKMTRGAA